jgi:hypothetical protein
MSRVDLILAAWGKVSFGIYFVDVGTDACGQFSPLLYIGASGQLRANRQLNEGTGGANQAHLFD